MPCYDKKLEASREDFYNDIYRTRDVDCVISTSMLFYSISLMIWFVKSKQLQYTAGSSNKIITNLFRYRWRCDFGVELLYIFDVMIHLLCYKPVSVYGQEILFD